jgi:hypothetical protein
MHHSIFKDRVAALIRRGPAHAEVRLRYRSFVKRYPVANLDAAIALVARRRCVELEARAVAIGSWGHCSHFRLTLMLLDEVRLILRLLRRYAPERFPRLIAEIRAGDLATCTRIRAPADAAE